MKVMTMTIALLISGAAASGFAGTNEINAANNPSIVDFLRASVNVVTNGTVADVVKQADIATIVFPFEIRSAAPQMVWGVNLRSDIDKAKTFCPPPEREPSYWLEAILVMKDGRIIKAQSSGEWLKVTTATKCGKPWGQPLIINIARLAGL